MDAEALAQEGLMVKMLAGSHAYGTSLPTSDIDYRGIFCAPEICIRTPFYPIREATDSSEEDTKFLELRHFMKLCLDCNPNVIELLWTDTKDIVFQHEAYEYMRQFRAEFLSSKIAFTTSGYAMAQLKRIKGHNKWISNPQPEQSPVPSEFVTLVQWFGKERMMPTEFSIQNFNHGYLLVPYSETLFGVVAQDGWQTVNDDGSLNTRFEGERSTLPNPIAFIKWNRDEYKAAKEKHGQYWTWKKNRNEVRSELEEQFGYDTKHAMHLVRLMRMGLETLRDGHVLVKRPDAAELLAIRAGAWTYEQIIQFAEEMDNEVRNVWYKKTALPKTPNIQRAAEILIDVQDLMWERNGWGY